MGLTLLTLQITGCATVPESVEVSDVEELQDLTLKTEKETRHGVDKA